MKKRLISLALALVAIVSLCTVPAAAADTQTSVRVNGYLVETPAQTPSVDKIDNTTMFPVQFVADTLKAEVSWDAKIQGAVIVYNGVTVQLPVGSKTMTVMKDGVPTTVILETEITKTNGKTMAPIKPLMTALGAWIGYAPYYKTIQVYDDVLTPAEITALHALENKRPVCDARKPLVSNGAPFANTNECMFREFHSDVNYTVRNLYNGDTYVNGVDREEDEIMLLADYIQSAMTERYTRESKGVHATFRTDASCIFAQTTSTNVSYLNRGYLTLTVDNDADLASYKKLNKLARVEDIRPGNTYTFVIESVWMINIAQGMPWRMGTFDRTNGTYTQI